MKRYEDPTTELDVYRLTDPRTPAPFRPTITAPSPAIAGLCCSAATAAGTPQALRMDLKTGETRELTDAEDLDGSSFTLTPDNRSFCYFAGRGLYISTVGGRASRCTRCPTVGSAAPG